MNDILQTSIEIGHYAAGAFSGWAFFLIVMLLYRRFCRGPQVFSLPMVIWQIIAFSLGGTLTANAFRNGESLAGFLTTPLIILGALAFVSIIRLIIVAVNKYEQCYGNGKKEGDPEAAV